jgi:hypothetical protein
VAFETSGIGGTDLDCELKFVIGGGQISIDIKKAESDAAALVYRVLVAVSRAQVLNAYMITPQPLINIYIYSYIVLIGGGVIL